MTYRNDHEAALARVDALEHEVATLRASRVETSAGATRAPRRRALWLLGGAGLCLSAGVVAGVVLGLVGTPDASTRALPGPSGDRSALVRCANAIAPATGLDARGTDPRGAHPVSVAAIGRTGAACRDELHELLERGLLSPSERDALWAWAVQEDELAGAISRIEVYYASDPYKLDGYSTAKQLWVEYDRVRETRDRALDAWRVQLGGG